MSNEKDAKKLAAFMADYKTADEAWASPIHESRTMTTDITIKFVKLVPEAVIPQHSREGDVGFDVFATETITLLPHETYPVPTGLVLAYMDPQDPAGNDVFLKVEGRSGLAVKGIFPVGGIIDPTYRGECKVILHNSRDTGYRVNKGDKIAQFIVYKTAASSRNVNMEETTVVEETIRGSNGFGSSGR